MKLKIDLHAQKQDQGASQKLRYTCVKIMPCLFFNMVNRILPTETFCIYGWWHSRYLPKLAWLWLYMVLKPCFDHRYVCFKKLSRLDRSLALTIVMILFKEPLWPDGSRLKNFREHETPYAFLYLSKLGELITFASLSFPIICDKRMICQFHIFLQSFFYCDFGHH